MNRSSPQKHARLLQWFMIAGAAAVLLVVLFLSQGRNFHEVESSVSGRPEVPAPNALETTALSQSSRAPAQESAHTPRVEELGGTLEVLHIYSRHPVSNLLLTLRSSVGRDVHRVMTGATGHAAVPDGHWLIEAEGDYAVATRSITIRNGEIALLWAADKKVLEVHVLTGEGIPVPNATVSWQARLRGLDDPDPSEMETRTTDAQGVAAFHEWMEFPGALRVLADGWALAERAIQGPVQVPLVVLMRRIGSSGSLCMTDNAGKPLPNAHVRANLGTFGPSDANGIVPWPSWISPDEEVTVLCEGYVPTRAFGGSLDCIRIHALAELHVTVTGNAIGAKVLVDCSPLRVADERVVTQRMLPIQGDSAILSVPREVPMRLAAIDTQGRYGVRELEVLGESERVSIELNEAPFRVRCESATQVPIQASIDVQHESQSTPLTLIASPTVGVPFPGEIALMELSAPGHETVQLRPITGPSARYDEGEVRVVLQPSSELRLRVRAAGTNEPMPGMRLMAWPDITGIKEHPSLFGGWPTNHPGWAIHRGVMFRGTTAVDGVWSARLPHGSYRIDIDTPQEYGAPNTTRTLYPLQTRRIAFDGQSEIALAVPQPVFVSLDVYEETTRLPVDSIQVGADVIPEPIRKGNHWEGWIAEGTRQLTIVVPNVGGTIVDLPLESSSIFVSSENAGYIVINDAPADLRGERIDVQLYEKWGQDHIGFARTAVTVGADGRARLFLPYVEVQEFSLVGREGWVFTPEYAQWEPGRTFVFEATRE